MCGAKQGLDGSSALARTLRSDKEPVFLADSYRTDYVFYRVVINRQVAGVCVAYQSGPAFECVVECFGGCAAVGGLACGFASASRKASSTGRLSCFHSC